MFCRLEIQYGFINLNILIILKTYFIKYYLSINNLPQKGMSFNVIGNIAFN